jgi:hypothetical protein
VVKFPPQPPACDVKDVFSIHVPKVIAGGFCKKLLLPVEL